MKKVEYWEAEDGKRFDTEAECIGYENRFKELSEKVKFFDTDYKLLTKDFITNAEECYAMYIPTYETAEKLHETFEKEGVESPFDRGYNRRPKSGHYFYTVRWHCLEEEKAKINEIEMNFTNARNLI